MYEVLQTLSSMKYLEEKEECADNEKACFSCQYWLLFECNDNEILLQYKLKKETW